MNHAKNTFNHFQGFRNEERNRGLPRPYPLLRGKCVGIRLSNEEPVLENFDDVNSLADVMEWRGLRDEAEKVERRSSLPPRDERQGHTAAIFTIANRSPPLSATPNIAATTESCPSW